MKSRSLSILVNFDHEPSLVFTIAAAFIWREQSGNQVGSNKRKIWKKKKKEAFSRKIVLGFYLVPPLRRIYIEFVLVNKHYRIVCSGRRIVYFEQCKSWETRLLIYNAWVDEVFANQSLYLARAKFLMNGAVG